MQVQYIWKDSDFLNKEWGSRRVTSYWVQATRADLAHILPLVSDTEDLLTDIEIHSPNEAAPFYLLVAQDLSSIVCMSPHYPQGGQWNGLSPFEEISPVQIAHLSELQSLDVG